MEFGSKYLLIENDDNLNVDNEGLRMNEDENSIFCFFIKFIKFKKSFLKQPKKNQGLI